MSLLWFLSRRNATRPSCSNVGGESRIWHSLLTAARTSLLRVARQPMRAPHAESRFEIESTRIAFSPARERHDAGRLAVVHELPIGLVRDDEQAVFDGELGEPGDLVDRVADPRRIGRIREEDRTRARRDQLLDFGTSAEMKPIFDARRDRDDPVAVHHRVPDVVRVERLGDQDLVPGLHVAWRAKQNASLPPIVTMNSSWARWMPNSP